MCGGYCHPAYVQALAEFGAPRPLPGCGGWILERPIPGDATGDAIGPYPLFTCADWSALPQDLEQLRTSLVCVALVADPLAEVSETHLRRCFDRVIHFKDHYVVECDAPPQMSKHHRYYARKALERVRVERCEEPRLLLARWVELYEHLVKRHRLRGIKAFSRQSFARQFEVPGLVMLTARAGDELVGAHLWFVSGPAAYSHLMALNDAGYALNASYALYLKAIEEAAHWFGGAVRRLGLGSAAGLAGDPTDGLALFKRGWTNRSVPAFFCGRVLDPNQYARLSAPFGPTDYFPAYRKGEFA